MTARQLMIYIYITKYDKLVLLTVVSVSLMFYTLFIETIYKTK